MKEKIFIEWLQQNRIQSLDSVFVFLSDYVTAVTVVVLLVLLYRVFIKKELDKGFFYLPFFALLLAGFLVNIIKIIIQRPRPYRLFSGLIHPVDAGGYSFPSGHTAEVFVWFFSVFVLTKNLYWRIIALIWAGFIVYTRVLFGAHYPSDIAGGILVAAFSVWLTLKILSKHFKKSLSDIK